jgi:hypothetical protein
MAEGESSRTPGRLEPHQPRDSVFQAPVPEGPWPVWRLASTGPSAVLTSPNGVRTSKAFSRSGSCDLVPFGAGVAAAQGCPLQLRRQPLRKRQRSHRFQSPVTSGPNQHVGRCRRRDRAVPRVCGQAARPSDAVRPIGCTTLQGWADPVRSPKPRPHAVSRKPPSAAPALVSPAPQSTRRSLPSRPPLGAFQQFHPRRRRRLDEGWPTGSAGT